jgi:hypothetical protein
MEDILTDVNQDGKKEKAEEERQGPGQDGSEALPEAGVAPGTPQPQAEEIDGAGGGAGADVLRATEGGGAVLRMVQVATEGLKPINLYGTTPGVIQTSELLLKLGYKMPQVDDEKVVNMYDPGTQHTAVKPDLKIRPVIEAAATSIIQHYLDSCGPDAMTGVTYQQVTPYLPVPFTNIYLMYDDGVGQEADELDYVKSQVQDRLHESNVIVVYSSADILSVMEAFDE